MRSERQILASRANGARSRGPVTAEGKRRSSRNAVSHGLLAEVVVLPGESQDAFCRLLTDYLKRFEPANEFELGFMHRNTGPGL